MVVKDCMVFADPAQETCPQPGHQWDQCCLHQPAWLVLGLEEHTVVVPLMQADCHVAFQLAHWLLVTETWTGCHNWNTSSEKKSCGNNCRMTLKTEMKMTLRSSSKKTSGYGL